MSSKALAVTDLKDKQVQELLKLQQLFHSHFLTQELVNGMIGLYVKCAENINQNQQPLRIFFMEKIRFVLSRPEIIRILEKKSTTQNKKVKQASNEMYGTSQEDMEYKKMAEQAKQEIRQNHLITVKKERNYEKTEKGEQMRQKEMKMQIQMQVQIMQEMEDNMQKMKKEFMNAGEANNKKMKQIDRIVQKQDMALNERLAKRKKKLRKKSVDIKDKEFIQIQAPEPIAKKELLEMKKEIHQTYERFTRLTMNKTKRATQRRNENQGRVKIQIQQAPIYQEDIFDQLEKERNTKIEQSKGFAKKKKTSREEDLQRNEIVQNNKKQQKPFLVQQQKQEVKEKQEVKVVPKARDSESSVEYKAFDQNKGRVTVRQKEYEQIQQEQLF